jgi:protein MpaA
MNRAAGLVVCAVLASGCAALRPARPAPTGDVPRSQVVGHSVLGEPIEVFTCGRGTGGVLVVGGTHGDERASALVVRELAKRLRCPPGGCAVTILPAFNPDGLALVARGNARGVDLNRNLPARSWTRRPPHGDRPGSEPESRALHDLLVRVRPALTISVHESSLPLVDYDGPGAPTAHALAACIGLDTSKIGALPGSLGSLVGVDWGLAVVTVELPPEASRLSSEVLWARYGRCLLEAVVQHGAAARSFTPATRRC